jgi:hypothetical protein
MDGNKLCCETAIIVCFVEINVNFIDNFVFTAIF